MADMTETLLSEVIVELRKNREEIEKGNRDPSLASSIKQNAGEIGNAILLAGRSERFAKEERTTEVDDEIVTSREDNTTMLQQILNAVTDTNKKTPSPSKKKSEGKQERSFIKKLLGPIAELPKSLKETFSFLTNEKGGLFDFGGFLGKVRLLSLLVALPFFLNSKIFEDMLFLIDKVIIPGFTKLNNFLKTNLTEPLNELGELLGLGELGDTIANLLLAAGGFALISSSFRKFLFGPKGFVALFLSPKNNIFSRISRFGRGIVTDTKGVERKRDATGKFTKIKRGKIPFIGGLVKAVPRAIGLALRTAGPVGLIVSAIIGVVEGAVAAVKTFLSGEGIVASFGAFVGGFFKSITAPLVFLFDLIKGFLPEGLVNAIQNTATEITSKLAGIGQFFGDLFRSIGGIFTDFGGFIDKIKEFSFKDMFEGVKKKVTDFFKNIGDFGGVLELPSIDDIVASIKEFGKNIGKIVKDFLPSLDDLKSAGGKVLGGIKSLFSSESEEDKIDAAVQAALQQHFETFHQRADAMNENALNKIEGGQTTVVTTASIDNSNNSKVESVQHNMKQIAHTDPIQQQIANAT